MGLEGILNIEMDFKVKVGDWVRDELIPSLMKNFETMKEFTEENKVVILDGIYSYWTEIDDCYDILYFTVNEDVYKVVSSPYSQTITYFENGDRDKGLQIYLHINDANGDKNTAKMPYFITIETLSIYSKDMMGFASTLKMKMK